MTRLLRAGSGAAITVTLIAALCLCARPVRSRVLETAGRTLVIDGPVTRSDVIVVGVGASSAGAIEAVDLVHEGLSNRVAVFAEPPDPVAAEFARRGIPYDDMGETTVRTIRALGVAAVERIPYVASGTEQEVSLLAGWCRERGIRSVIVVTTRDHSRRLARLLRRSVTSGTLRFTVRGARHSTFDPDQWWRSRAGLRVGLVELQKLALDVVRHPAS